MNGVTFRRIHGRVIPIRDDGMRAKDIGKGAAYAGAGVATAAAAGNIAGRMTKQSHRMANASMRFEVEAGKAWSKMKSGSQLDMLKKTVRDPHSLMKRSEKFKLKGDKLFTRGVKVKNAGRVAGATLIATGANEVLKKTRFKEDEKTRAAISTGAGISAQFLIENSFAKKTGGMRGIRLAKYILKKAIRKGRV